MNSLKSRISVFLKKFTASIIAFHLVLSPFGVLAQSTATTTDTSGESATTTEPAPETALPPSDDSSGDSPLGLLDSGELGSGTEVDVGKNAIKSGHKLEPSIFDGSLQYEIPLTIPPGRNGLEPQLSLAYSSRPQQESSIFGRGWSLAIPYIERRNYIGADELYNYAAYFSSFDGELASTTASTTFKAKNDSGSFLQYTLNASTTSTNTHSLDLESGSSQYASIADASQAGLDLSGDLTLALRVKIESFVGGTLVRKGRGDDSQRSYVFSLDSSSLSASFSNSGTTQETETVSWSPSTATWYHVTVTRSGSTVKFYVNGTQQGSDQTNSTGTLFNSNRPFLVGASEDSGGNPEGLFDGLVDDLRVWSRALSSSEVSSLNSSPGSFNNGSDTVGFWRFNNTYSDDSGGNNLTGNGTFSTDVSFSDDVSNTSPNYWTVTDKQGRSYKFGHSTSTRLYDETGGSGRTYRWMLEEVRDLNDNYVSYSYTRDSNQLYPDIITYTGNGSSTGKFNVRFAKELRNDIATSSAEGFTVATKYRIKQIQAEVDSSWARKYVLDYAAGDNGERSLLAGITEHGFDGNSTTSLESHLFTVASSTDSWSSATSTWSIPDNIVDANYADTGARLADANGDGLPDLLRRDDDASANVVYMNKGDGTWLTSSWSIPFSLKATSSHPGILVMDVNGDGLVDLMRYKAGGTNQIYLNNGSGWTLSSATVPVPLADSIGEDYGVRTADINGDGLSDLLVYNKSQNWHAVYLGNGSGFATSTRWTLPEATIDVGNKDVGTRFADVNGDGLADLLRANETANKVYLNTSSGFELSTWVLPSGIKFMDSFADQGVRIEDVNGDGLNDLIRNATTSSPNGVYLNTGKGWLLDSSWTIPLATLGIDGQKDIGTRLLDLDGDGLLDMVRRRTGESSEVYLRNGRRPDLMATSTNPRGGKIGVTYQGSPEYRTATGVANPYLPLTLDTVKTLTYDDRISSTTQKTFAYDGGQYYTGNVRERKFAGFATTTATDELGYVTKHFFHQGSSTQSTIGEYQDHIAKVGKPYRTEILDDTGGVYQKTIQKWDRFDRGDGASFIFLGEALDITHDGDASTKSRADVFTYNTASGTLAQKIEYGEVTGSDDGTFTDTGTDKFTTGFRYATSTATSTILALSREETLNQSSTTIREKRIYYDTLSLGSLNKGNPTKEEMWVSGSTYIDTEKSYNSFGLVFEEKDPRDNTTTHVYDAAKLYVATTTNPAGHITHRVYDYSSGKVARLTDINGSIFEITYDGLDRVTEEKQPDLTSTTTLVTKTTYQYTDTGLPTRVLKTDYLNSATSSESYIYFDGFGRKTEERIETEDANYSVKDTRYDQKGLVKTESMPYFSNGTTYTGTSSPPTSSLLTTFTYDPRNRVESIANAVGSTTYAYSDWTVTITDPNSNQKDLTNDAFGNLITVTEYSPGATTTQYQYDGNQRLTKITDSLANVRNFTYDGLGRRLTAEDLHLSSDGIFGTTTYAYDAAGNLATTNDAKGQIVTYTYDSLNRVLTEDYTGASGTEISYTYDTCATGKGKLCFAATSNASTSLSYNALGGVLAEARTISGTQYASTTFAYDRQGNQTQITYPDGREVSYGYDSAGKLAEVKSRASGGAWSTILSDIDYAAHGAPSLHAYGNGISIPRTYDDTKLYRLTRIGDAGSSAVQDINYTYDAVGNITEITDNSSSGAGKTVLFTYDTLNRLISASTTAASSTPYYEGYTYNSIGNLLYKGSGTVSTSSVANTHSLDLESGSSQYAEITDANQVGLDLSGDLTLSMWIKAESFAGAAEIPFLVKRVGADSNRSYHWKMSSAGTVVGFLWYTNGSSIGGNLSVPWSASTSTWYHVAVTKSGTTVKFYVDGSQQGSDQTGSSATVYNGTAPVEIGGWIDGVEYWDGLIDDVRVWSRALSDSEISDLETSPGTFANGSSHQGFWKLDGGYTDSSANANTLTGQNSPVFSADVPFEGTIVSSSATTTYTYSTTTAGYENPHAVKQINPASAGVATSTYAYDNNGNLTSVWGSASTTFAWDYRNRMTGSATSTQTGTTTYLYDHTEQRVRKSSGTATTTYVNRFYDTTNVTATSSATTTSYIWAGDMLVAFVEGNGYATSTRFVHSDHLGSTNVVTDSGGTVVQTLDYYPFGATRVDSGPDISQREYIGQHYDEGSSLSYLNARYYEGGRGQFLSQDPVFWEIGQTQTGKAALLDPQLQNSYSYASNNPIAQKDPDGRFIQAIALGALYGGIANIASQGYSDYQSGQFSGYGNYGLSFLSGAAVGAATVLNPIFGGSVAAGTSLGQEYIRNDSFTYEGAVNATAQGLVTGFTGGFLKGLPQVRGVQATNVFGWNYFGGAHGIHYALEALFGLGTDIHYQNIQQISQNLLNFYAPKTTTSGSSGGGGNINQLSQSVISYANASGANLSDSGFIAGIRAINEYNNSLAMPNKK